MNLKLQEGLVAPTNCWGKFSDIRSRRRPAKKMLIRRIAVWGSLVRTGTVAPLATWRCHAPVNWAAKNKIQKRNTMRARGGDRRDGVATTTAHHHWEASRCWHVNSTSRTSKRTQRYPYWRVINIEESYLFILKNIWTFLQYLDVNAVNS